MRNLLLSVSALLLLLGNLSAQTHRDCGVMEVLARQLQENPDLQQQMQDIENHTAQYIQAGGAAERTVVTIPVVFHVVWNTAAENLSDAELLSQLTVLNNDFRKLNADAANVPAVWQSLAADCEINFCLATQDPSGQATTGILRRQTTVTSFSTNDAVKYTAQGGDNIWDRNKYLNIWVCDLGGGLLGYAQFPGGPAATDGVVCDYAYFGTIGSTPPFNKGRTATHEVGHWLNLYHIWGDDGTSCSGSDNCADTPNQADENYGCPSFPTVSCTNGPNGDMFMNYMDYTDDACMYMFTTGQKNRVQSLFATGGARASLATSPGCSPPSGGSCGTPSGLNATGITQTSAVLGWSAISGATSYNLQWKISTSGSWTTVSGLTTTAYTLSGLAANTTYNYQVQAVCSGTSSSYSAASSFTTLSNGGGGCTDAYETNNTLATAKTIPTGTAFTAQIATSTDKDYYKFSNTSTLRKVKVELTTLPFDYDLRLYRDGSQVGISQNGGTTSEVIIYNSNSSAIATYTAYVYGYNGAFSNTQCYTLKASLSASNWRTDGSGDGPVEEIEIPVVFANEGFGMFPNPATDQVIVEVPIKENDTDVTVSLLDPSGKLTMMQRRAVVKGDNRFSFQLSELPVGIYFVQVRNGDTTTTRKLMVGN